MIFCVLNNCASGSSQKTQKIQINGGCAYDKAEILKDVELYEPSDAAVAFVDKILHYSGLPNRFEIKEAQVNNAIAVVLGAKRYILLDRNFMASVNQQAGTNWAFVAILAHEIGHHLNAHGLSGGSRPENELEADYYSGYALGMMGANEDQAKSAMMVLPDPIVVTTHPKKEDRLAAISNGWLTATENKRREPEKLDGEENQPAGPNGDSNGGKPSLRKKKKKRQKKGRLSAMPENLEPQTTLVEFSDMITSHNAIQNDVKGLYIQFQIDAIHLRSNKIRLFLLFYDNNNELVKDRNGLWSSTDGFAVGFHDLEVSDANMQKSGVRFPHLSMFFPYNEIELSAGTHDISYAIRYSEWDSEGRLRFVKESPRIKFRLQNPEN